MSPRITWRLDQFPGEPSDMPQHHPTPAHDRRDGWPPGRDRGGSTPDWTTFRVDGPTLDKQDDLAIPIILPPGLRPQ